jgi:hypothetical protein
MKLEVFFGIDTRILGIGVIFVGGYFEEDIKEACRSFLSIKC